jgi:DNA repair protein RecO (recombination protein O)
MRLTSTAIIMRTWEYGESDLLVSFFTPDQGRLKGVAKGARKSLKRFSNCLDPFCVSRLEYEKKAGRELCFLHSGKLVEVFPAVRSDFTSLALASYMLEFTEVFFPLGVVEERMFDLMSRMLTFMEQGEDPKKVRIMFEARALALAGYGINLTRCAVCGRSYAGEGRAVFMHSSGAISCLKCGKETDLSPGMGPDSVGVLRTLQTPSVADLTAVRFREETVGEIRPVLDLHIEYHTSKRFKSAAYLK